MNMLNMIGDPDYAVAGLFEQRVQPRFFLASVLVIVNSAVQNLFCLIDNYKAARMSGGYVHASNDSHFAAIMGFSY